MVYLSMSNKPIDLFWPKLRDAYQAFCTLSDEGDWQSIILQIAAIVASNAIAPRHILDYGAGLGSTAASIRRRLYGDHGLPSSWVLYDPDSFARSASLISMPELGKSMAIGIADVIPIEGKFDVVLFVHTSYYITDFDKELDRVFESLLSTESGFVICVAMPRVSPFFIEGLNNMHRWTAESIVDMASNKGMKCDVIKMRSRFRWLSELTSDSLLSRLITSFVCGTPSISESEIDVVNNNLVGEVDFGDWLIVIKGR